MSESPEARARRRWITFGEVIALAALIVSAVGVWLAWKSSNQDRPTRVVEQRSTVPLALRGTVDSDGRSLTLIPADPSHGLESATVTIKGASPIQVGSDGRLVASDVESALKDDKEEKDVIYSVPIRISALYVENGVDRHGGGPYLLRYKWHGGGLFGSRSIQLVGLSKT